MWLNRVKINPFVISWFLICFCLQVNFQHWSSGEPNNQNNAESCAEFIGHKRDWSGSWNDEQCEKYNGWLCQIRAGKAWSFDYIGFKEKHVISVYSHLLLSDLSDWGDWSQQHLVSTITSILCSKCNYLIYCLCPYRKDTKAASRPCQT